jgi:hypothetical protein
MFLSNQEREKVTFDRKERDRLFGFVLSGSNQAREGRLVNA